MHKYRLKNYIFRTLNTNDERCENVLHCSLGDYYKVCYGDIVTYKEMSYTDLIARRGVTRSDRV